MTPETAATPAQPSAQPMPPHVLAVDHDPGVRELIAGYLRQNAFRATTVSSGSAIREVLESEVVDLIVLDVTPRGEDAIALTLRLRAESTIPIIMLSGCSDEADRVMGLELGADDFLTKPFSPRELLARIRTVLRRRRAPLRQGRPEGIRAYRFDGCELSVNTRRLARADGQAAQITNGQFSLLSALLGASGRVLSRDQLLDLSRLHSDEVYLRTIDVQINRLRRKIEADPARPRVIVTQRGAGYRLGVPVQTVY
jgi:two-component system, OmpR family, response regulator